MLAKEKIEIIRIEDVFVLCVFIKKKKKKIIDICF